MTGGHLGGKDIIPHILGKALVTPMGLLLSLAGANLGSLCRAS